MRVAKASSSGKVIFVPMALVTKACKTSVVKAWLPESSMTLTSKASVIGSLVAVGVSIFKPVSLEDGAGGATSCICCKIDPASGMTSTAKVIIGDRANSAAKIGVFIMFINSLQVRVLVINSKKAL